MFQRPTAVNKVVSIQAAVDTIDAGATIGIGGFIHANKPCALVREIARRRIGNLAVVAAPTSYDLDLLVGLGLVRSAMTPYCGFEGLAPIAPFFGGRAGRTFVVQDVDNGALIAMLRARIQRIPFMPVHVLGTSLLDLNDNLATCTDPFSGETIAIARPVHIDVTLLHADASDPLGNVQHNGPVYIDHLLARAADRVIVEVEKIVDTDMVVKDATKTTVPCDTTTMVCYTPYGSHPASSPGNYGADQAFLRAYVEASRQALKDHSARFDEFVATYVDGPKTHAEYCQLLGSDKLFALAYSGKAENSG